MFVKHLSLRYELDEPLKCLLKDPPKKSEYKVLILTKITASYERKLMADAKGNSCQTNPVGHHIAGSVVIPTLLRISPKYKHLVAHMMR